MTKRQSGFTLIEIIVVITIMLIIGAVGVKVAGNVIEKAKVNTTKAAMQNITSALEEYFRDTGGYPDPKLEIYAEEDYELFWNSEVCRMLNENTNSRQIINKLPEEFIRLETLQSGVSSLILIDSWNNPMKYRYVGNNNFPKITSAGKDMNFGTADDIISTDINY